MKSKKKILAAVLAAALTCSGLPIQGVGTMNVFAEEETASEFEIDENGVLVKYNGDGGDVVIPEGVTKIGDSAFMHCKSLTSVTIPEGVTSIGYNAFFYCWSLTSVTFPKSVTEIGSNAFYETKWLEEKKKENPLVIVNNIVIDGTTCDGDVEIPEVVTSIVDSAFGSCIGLTSITIPESVIYIGGSAFNNCSSLTNITVDGENSKYDSREDCNAIIETESNKLIAGCKNTIIPEGVTSIGDFAFCGCSGITSLTIPEGVTNIGDFAFRGCSGITSLTIPEGVSNIGDFAFDSCSSLTSLTIQKGVTSIGEQAFGQCSSLTSITISEGVTIISDLAFYDCNSLTSIIIPEGVKSIRDGAFEFCIELTSITIPESVTEIGNAFYRCDKLTTIKGKKGSYAETYAKENGYRFVDIDADDTDDNNTGDNNTGDNSTVLMGDLNGDKKVNLNDATMLLKAAVGIITLTDDQKKVSDLNNDMKINLNDATVLLRIAVGIA